MGKCSMYIIILFLIVFPSSVFSQIAKVNQINIGRDSSDTPAKRVKDTGKMPRFELGIFGGVGYYEGDLMPASLKELNKFDDIVKGLGAVRPAFGLQMRYNANRFLGFRGQFGFIQLGMDENKFTLPDAGRQIRGFSFEGSVAEGALLAEFDLLGKTKKGKKLRYRAVSPYLAAGVGVAALNPRPNFNIANPAINYLLPLIGADKAADFNKTVLAVPFGGGLRFGLGSHWSLGLETLLRYTPSDYVDGISLSANPDLEDWYLTTGLTLTYRFQKSDRDRDGIADLDDPCPGEAGPDGCPDADGDGVPDKNDQCPDEAGPKALKGCPESAVMDYDDDGVVDRKDECPDKPGPRSNKGCPTPEMEAAAKDTDSDGIPDIHDACPDKAGEKRWGGCPDTDADGMPDNLDKCPNDAGKIDMGGCPDKDRDGVADKDDKCPDVPGLVEREGCPKPGTIDLTGDVVVTKVILFGINANGYDPRYQKILDEVAEALNANPGYRLRIEGHTDNTGRYPGNQRLSETRARSCYNALLKKGIPESRMSVAGFGKEKPVASNDTYEGRNQNRRVELILVQN
jgi:OmpA-OmpF porin, OOP family